MDALLNKILIYIACATSQTPFFVCVLIMTRKHLAAHNLLGRFAKLPGLALQIELATPYTTSSLSFFLVRRAKRPRHANDHACDWRREKGEAAALVSRVSRLRRSTLARACTPLTKSEEKERLLAV